jgi:hypothetical protein
VHARQDRALNGAANSASGVPRINEHYLNLRAAYLFAEIRRRQAAFTTAHRPRASSPSASVTSRGRCRPPSCARFNEAADDIALMNTARRRCYTGASSGEVAGSTLGPGSTRSLIHTAHFRDTGCSLLSRHAGVGRAVCCRFAVGRPNATRRVCSAIPTATRGSSRTAVGGAEPGGTVR